MATESYMGKITWVPEIGDPTIIGWVTVAVYFIVSLICLKAAFITKNDNSIKILWKFLTVFLIFLGINKQLDLQTLLTQLGREISIAQGWYQYRRTVQVGFIILIGLSGIAGMFLLIQTFRSASAAIKIALTGSIILLVFILIRASSFHHIELLINFELTGTRINWLLELGGLAVIGIGGYRYTASQNFTTS